MPLKSPLGAQITDVISVEKWLKGPHEKTKILPRVYRILCSLNSAEFWVFCFQTMLIIFCCCCVACPQPAWPLLTDMPGISESLVTLSFIWLVFKAMTWYSWGSGFGEIVRRFQRLFNSYFYVSLFLYDFFWATFEFLRACQFAHHKWI